jgi:hypothetical protein
MSEAMDLFGVAISELELGGIIANLATMPSVDMVGEQWFN